MKHFSHLNTAVEIIGLYKGAQPFHFFIKAFFKRYKKYGSRDRKQITHLCYCYFRLGNALKNRPLEESILQALFLCSDQSNELLSAIKPAWIEKINATPQEKCTLLHIPVESLHIFPFPDQLSDGIQAAAFNLSHLIQPDLFLRIRPGFQQAVINKLQQAGIAYNLPLANCISLPNTTKIDELLQVNKEVVIQDYSSQRTGSFMQIAGESISTPVTWDCCAASGGKSILAKDLLGNIDLTVSDIRPSVLANLAKRFGEAGIKNYTIIPADLTKPGTRNLPHGFQFIIADAPCTGAGTWGRSPERLTFFDEKEIDSYNQLQKKIVTAVIPALQNGGFFLYITCSVFKKENEGMVSFIQENNVMELVKMELLKGYSDKADTMFAALLRKK
ncbi:MAG: Fmu (Sun) domain-containing protein [Chitinophagaceae bacterium]